MTQWFECKVKYEKMTESGALKVVAEPYMVDALSFTEAEARITEEMQPFLKGGQEFTVSAVRRVKLTDVFYNDGGDRWYKVKTNLITIDEKTAVEKRTATFQLVQASNFAEALQVFMDNMKSTLADFEVAAITETMLMDVFPARYETLEEKAARQQAATKPAEE